MTFTPPRSVPVRSSSTRAPTRTVVVLGASYGGARASRLIAHSLPPDWRLVVIDRNTHFNHVYVFPRYTVLAKHAPKCFVPYTNLFNNPDESQGANSTLASTPPTPALTPSTSIESLRDHQSKSRAIIQGSVTHLTSHSVTFTRPHSRTTRRYSDNDSESSSLKTHASVSAGHFDGPEETIEFDYCVYALGAGMPDPCNVWEQDPEVVSEDEVPQGIGSKQCGVKWMERRAELYQQADNVLIVGGGALGIQMAGDIKCVYPHKKVTLLHSRTRVMPIYPIEMHVGVLEGLQKLGVEVVLGERVVSWPENPEKLDGKTKLVHTDKGREFRADIVLPCTGQKPHSSMMAELCPSTISPVNSRIRVKPTLQVSPTPTRPINSRAGTLDRLANLSLHAPSDNETSPTSYATTIEDDVEDEDLQHIFAIGDCADTDAIQAGHTAYWQGEVAARNILRLIAQAEGKGDEELEHYQHGAPAIKVTLGLTDAVTSNVSGTKYTSEGVEDLQARVLWSSFQVEDLPDDA